MAIPDHMQWAHVSRLEGMMQIANQYPPFRTKNKIDLRLWILLWIHSILGKEE